MSKPKHVEIARRMTAVGVRRRLESLEQSCETQLTDLSQRGLGQSGVALEVIGRLYSAEVREVCQLAWQNLWRAAIAIGLEPSPDLAERLKTEMREQTDPGLGTLRTRLGQHAGQLGYDVSGPSRAFARARDSALDEIDAEIDIAVASLESRAATEGIRVVQQFYGPVGVAQSGSHMSASVVQNIGAQEKGELTTALTGLLDAIQRSAELQGREKTEVIELIQEARDEITKPIPNGLRLTSALRGIASTVQTLGSAEAAYQVLKATAALVGIPLP